MTREVESSIKEYTKFLNEPIKDEKTKEVALESLENIKKSDPENAENLRNGLRAILTEREKKI